MNSTTETANENFITDHGSMRLRFSRARRGPRAAAEVTVDRAERTASETRAAPTAAAPAAWLLAAAGPAPAPCGVPGRPGWPPVGRPCGPPGRCDWAVPGLAGGWFAMRPDCVPGAVPLPLVTTGTVAEPLATAGGPCRFGSAGAVPSACGSPGGGAMPGALVNLGWDGASAGTATRPEASRPAGAEPSFGSPSTGVVEVPEPPDVAVVSVIN